MIIAEISDKVLSIQSMYCIGIIIGTSIYILKHKIDTRVSKSLLFIVSIIWILFMNWNYINPTQFDYDINKMIGIEIGNKYWVHQLISSVIPLFSTFIPTNKKKRLTMGRT